MQKLWGFVGGFFIIYFIPWLGGLAHSLVIVFLCALIGLGAFLKAWFVGLSMFFLSLTINLINSNKRLWKTKN